MSRWELGTVHRVHALAAALDLDVREFLVLSELVIRPNGLTGAELTAVVGGSAARMSVLLAGLVRRGLVERDPDPSDRRSIVSGATERAHELLARWAPDDLRHRLVGAFARSEQLDTVARFVDIATDLAYAEARYLRDRRSQR